MTQVWHRAWSRDAASPHALTILDKVERKLAALDDPAPVVASISIGAGLGDLHDFEVETVLAPDVVLATRYQSVDEDGRDPDALEDEAGAVARQAVETVREFHAHGVANLADMLHDMRRRTRVALAGWRDAGIHVTLGDIRLVRTEHWRLEEALTVEVRLRALGEGLRPAVDTVCVAQPDMLEAQLANRRAGHAARYAAQAALARHGADGMVDLLALNAIAQQGDGAAALRGIAQGYAYGLTSALTVFMHDGHVRCHGSDPNGNLVWNRSGVRIEGRSLPSTVADALRGRPVTQLIEHPVLSDEMVLTDVTSSFEYGTHTIRAEFEQPVLLFCSASGRTWRAETGMGRERRSGAVYAWRASASSSSANERR